MKYNYGNSTVSRFWRRGDEWSVMILEIRLWAVWFLRIWREGPGAQGLEKGTEREPQGKKELSVGPGESLAHTTLVPRDGPWI